MYEVRLEKRGILPAFVTVFLSGDKDIGRITLTSWASHHTSGPQSLPC